FRRAIDPTYYLAGTHHCVEISRHSDTAGLISAGLTWDERRLNLDLILMDASGVNFRQSTSANTTADGVQFFVNACTDYVFVVYLSGIDEFINRGAPFTGE